MCNDWKNDFGAFNQWAMNNGYQDGLTIDRIDNNKGYFPENCRWVTQKIQNRNYSRNHLLTYNGETMCLADMAKKIRNQPSYTFTPFEKWNFAERCT